ncbi:MAG TPA: rhodanese-like domain-containing protein, partial [Acidobacteriota bacterium]|nr:rhodanese-like domain-containing protein [Acidobacteriota bacterium]
LGMLFGKRLEWLMGSMRTMGTWLGAILVGILLAGLGTYMLWKILARKRFLRRLWVARISPEELKRKIESEEDIVIVDLRHPLEFDADPVLIPGAVHWNVEELAQRRRQLPQNREIILYCS